MKIIHWTLIFLNSYSFGLSQKITLPATASYVIDVSLDTLNKKLYGETELVWTNPSDDEIDHLLLHMYYNAFKNSNSTFFRERGVPDFLTRDIDNECGWGWTKITTIKDEYGNDLSTDLSYIQTDDANVDDQSVLKVPLKQNIKAKETIHIYFTWEAKIPKTMPRTGYNKEYYFMAQWFPKVGVYEPEGMRFAKEGGWNCHQYHSSGEYYSDFGSYDVSITVPENYKVAASGKRTDSSVQDGKITYRHQVDQVIDFTWSTSPHFVVQKDQYKETEILHYSYPYKQDYSKRYFTILKNNLEYLEDLLGPYPYPTLSLVDPPIHGMFTGGMEYPTIISSLSFKFLPDGIKMPETLATHEFIHQYFMQMVATHEVEEPWMDEGITTYMESRILDHYLGEHKSTIDVWGIQCGNKQWNRAEFFNSPNTDIGSNLLKSWEYKHGGYGDIAYNKVALWMQTLEGILGTDTMDLILHSYFNRWKFNHPCRNDFVDVVNEVVANNSSDKFPNGMDWFFKQVMEGTGSCDYAVGSIVNQQAYNDRGFLSNYDKCETLEKEVLKKYKSTVILRRHGELHFPQEIELRFEDGSSQRFNWDGRQRSHEIQVSTDSKIVSALLDPEEKIMMDKNFLNNSMSTNPNRSQSSRLSAKIQSCYQFIFELSTLLI